MISIPLTDALATRQRPLRHDIQQASETTTGKVSYADFARDYAARKPSDHDTPLNQVRVDRPANDRYAPNGIKEESNNATCSRRLTFDQVVKYRDHQIC